MCLVLTCVRTLAHAGPCGHEEFVCFYLLSSGVSVICFSILVLSLFSFVHDLVCVSMCVYSSLCVFASDGVLMCDSVYVHF